MCYVSNYARPLLRVDTNWAKSTKIVKNDGPYTDRHTQFLYCLVLSAKNCVYAQI